MTGGFDNPDFDDAALFGHLDDPNPPALGGDALTGVMARGHQIRARRRAIYAGSSAAVVIVIAGAAIGLAAGNNSPGHGKGPVVANSLSSSPHVTPTNHHKKHDGKSGSTSNPSGITGNGNGGGKGNGKHPNQGGGTPPTSVCVTITPDPVDTTAPVPSDTPTDGTTPVDTPPPVVDTPTPEVSCAPVTETPTPESTPTAPTGGNLPSSQPR